MITSSDIGNIMYRDCAANFNLPVFRFGDEPKGTAENAYIVVIPKALTRGGLWSSSYVEVNIVIPNLADGTANLEALEEAEHRANAVLGGNGRVVFGEYDGTAYRYRVESTSVEDDTTALKCHFVNAHILFQPINTIE